MQDFVQGSGEVLSLFGDGDEEVGAQRRPDLDADAVVRSAEESPQAQVLFEPTPEQFNAPAPAVDLGDEQGWQRKLVGEKHEVLTALRIDVADPAKRFGVGLLALAGVEPDGLIAAKARGLVERPRLSNVEANASLQARDEEGPGQMQRVQARKVEVSAVDHVVGSGIHWDLVEGDDFVPIPLVETGKDGDVLSEVQQDVQSQRGLVLLPPRPREQRQAQLDQGICWGQAETGTGIFEGATTKQSMCILVDADIARSPSDRPRRPCAARPRPPGVSPRPARRRAGRS